VYNFESFSRIGGIAVGPNRTFALAKRVLLVFAFALPALLGASRENIEKTMRKITTDKLAKQFAKYTDAEKQVALSCLIESGKGAMVRQLAESGANLSDDLLLDAVSASDLEMTQFLLEHHLKVNHQRDITIPQSQSQTFPNGAGGVGLQVSLTRTTDRRGATALYFAIKNKSPELVKLLLKYGADVHQAFMVQSAARDAALIASPIEIPVYELRTPLEFASSMGTKAVTDILAASEHQ
jgi:ankyrin repeat protein